MIYTYSGNFYLAPPQVYAAGSEDMDTLTFNTPILYRHLTFSEAKKQPISEINLLTALKGLEMDMSQVSNPVTSLPIFNPAVSSSSTCVSFLDVTTSNQSKA